jgi:hypothetical protein
VVTHAFDDGDGAGVTHGEAFAGDAAEVGLALRRAIEHGVADDDGVLRHDPRIIRRADDDAAARQALADIVVAVTDEVKGDATRKEGARMTGRPSRSA